MGLIAEVKKASPSKGLIREDFHPVEIAKAYERAGAHALSVLTDKPHFHGRPEYLGEARAATKLPVLRKDFILDEYQIYESRTWGADAILLIVAGLEMMQIVEFHSLARELGMDVLVEVHTDQEAQIAIELGCHFIGVNNRDLATFQTSLETSDKILSMIADQAFAVSESALETQKDVERVRRAGAKAVLIGTTFCAAPDVESKVREVMGW
ncbi:MAG: indole-3-glycerol phosphate synthase [Fimbriimonadaceae bacterium]|jgi:indole-3-glycerol phosphate synthase|nr:indole-3-glycerol phosphate synthase [Fimbriimonadaceae bacterium]